jgi:TPR repeat protein
MDTPRYYTAKLRTGPVAQLALSDGVVFAGLLEDGQAAYDRGDYGTALQLIMPFSAQGKAMAQYDLGLMYANGRGVPQEDKQAVKWFHLAAAKGVAAVRVALVGALSAAPAQAQNVRSHVSGLVGKMHCIGARG